MSLNDPKNELGEEPVEFGNVVQIRKWILAKLPFTVPVFNRNAIRGNKRSQSVRRPFLVSEITLVGSGDALIGHTKARSFGFSARLRGHLLSGSVPEFIAGKHSMGNSRAGAYSPFLRDLCLSEPVRERPFVNDPEREHCHLKAIPT